MLITDNQGNHGNYPLPVHDGGVRKLGVAMETTAPSPPPGGEPGETVVTTTHTGPDGVQHHHHHHHHHHHVCGRHRRMAAAGAAANGGQMYGNQDGRPLHHLTQGDLEVRTQLTVNHGAST